MLSLEKGMNSSEIEKTLGVKPYNLLHRNESTALFEYHYRLKDRVVSDISDYNYFIHQEHSQTGGKNWFTKPSKFYILFENNKLSTLITENGLENSDYLLLKNNNLMLVSQSDLVNLNLLENASYFHKIDNTKTLYTSKNVKQSILYSANFPHGLIGLKYAIGGKAGGYISGAFSLDWMKFTYLTGGFLMRVSPKVNVYVGSGLGPYVYYGYGGLRGMNKLVLETGTLLYLKKFSIDAGVGYNIYNGSLYGKIGFGINF